MTGIIFCHAIYQFKIQSGSTFLASFEMTLQNLRMFHYYCALWLVVPQGLVVCKAFLLNLAVVDSNEHSIFFIFSSLTYVTFKVLITEKISRKTCCRIVFFGMYFLGMGPHVSRVLEARSFWLLTVCLQHLFQTGKG